MKGGPSGQAALLSGGLATWPATVKNHVQHRQVAARPACYYGGWPARPGQALVFFLAIFTCITVFQAPRKKEKKKKKKERGSFILLKIPECKGRRQIMTGSKAKRMKNITAKERFVFF